MSQNYRQLSIDAIRKLLETMDEKYWEEYEVYHKLANKHFGICQAMWTKEKKRYGYTK